MLAELDAQCASFSGTYTPASSAAALCGASGISMAAATTACARFQGSATPYAACLTDFCATGTTNVTSGQDDVTVTAATPPAPPASVSCSHFAPTATTGGTLLQGAGSRFLGNTSRSIVFEGVHSEGACCALAQRYACSANPVRAWQLVHGTSCVVMRSGFVEAVGETRVTSLVGRSFAAAPSPSAPPSAPIYLSEHDNVLLSQCADTNSGSVAPCREDDAQPVCASASEPCFYDPLCKAGGLGCNAAGYESCRFCGFGDYESITCPGTIATQRVTASVDVPDSCPRACTANPTETCFYDAACTDPFSNEYRGGLGCNAGGRGQNCRFCGFAPPNGTALDSMGEDLGNELAYPDCPEPAAPLAALHTESSAAMHAVSAAGAASTVSTLTSVTTTTLEVATNGVSGGAAAIVSQLQSRLCAMRTEPSSACAASLVSYSTQAIPASTRRRALANGRGLQTTAPDQVQMVTIDVALDPTSIDAATLGAALNNNSAISDMLTALTGVSAAGVQWDATYTMHLSLSASLPASSVVSSAAMQAAIASAVGSSLSRDVGALSLTNFSTDMLPPLIGLFPTNPTNPTAGAPPPPGQATQPQLSSSSDVPAWGVTLIVISCVTICGLGALGLMLQMRSQAGGMTSVGLWPPSLKMNERAQVVGELRRGYAPEEKQSLAKEHEMVAPPHGPPVVAGHV